MIPAIFSYSKINDDLHVTKELGDRLIVADSGYADTDHIIN